MFKKSIHITVIFAISTLLQLINNIAVTRIFGANFDLDVFLAAVSIPAILVTVIYGTLNDAFLPLYGEMKIKNNKKADNYFVYSLFFLVIFSLIILFIFFLFSKPISALFYQNRGEEFVKNTAKQLSVMMFGIVPSVVATLFGAYYYFHKR